MNPAAPERSNGTDARLPVTLLTGFLGSGKTTLLASLLQRPGMARVAVIVNEFGEVPLDQALLARPDEHVVVLAGGCLCCAARGNIVAALTGLLERRARTPFDRVIIETSGLADPGPILAPLLLDPALRPHFRIDGVVATVDAIQGERELQRQPVSVKQVAIADRIVLTKSDIAGPGALARLRHLLAGINRWSPVLVANHGDVGQDWLLHPIDHAAQRLSWGGGAWGAHEEHVAGVASFCLWFDAPLAWGLLQACLTGLAEAHAERLLRVKGLLNIQGQAHPAALHGVGHFFHPPTQVQAWPDADRRSRIVFITDRLPESALRPFFARLLAPAETSVAA